MSSSNGWLGVEMRHLAALEAVAREGSFGAAATSLGYTQSAVSQQIAALERAVGQRLIDRPGGPRRVSLTEAGALLLRHAEGLVARLEAARADLDALSAGEAGTLRVGTFQSFGARVLPAVMRRFAAEWPRVSIELTEMRDDGALREAVERGALDLAFTDGADVPPLVGHHLLSDGYVLLVPADSPLVARAESPSVAEMAAMDLISFRSCSEAHRLERTMADARTPLHVVFRSDDNATVQGMVSAGMGAALLPRLAVEMSDPGVAAIDMSDRVPNRRISIVFDPDRHRSRAAEAFIAVAQDVCRELTETALPALV